MKDSISSKHRPKGYRTTDSQAGVLPPGHNCLTRRNVLKAVLASTGAAAFCSGVRAQTTKRRPDPRKGSPKRYAMKKSINQWAFPYPQRMNLKECLQLAKDSGFDGIELNYDLENALSPKSGTKDYQNIRRLADKIGIQISGLCSFLFWPYPLTSNDPDKRAKGIELAGKIAHAAHDLISLGETIMSRCPTTSVTVEPKKPSESWPARPKD